MNWYIGQEVVALVNHHCGLQKGKTYTIKRLACSICNCQEVLIDVGYYTGIPGYICAFCGGTFSQPARTGVWWLSEKRFAPALTLKEEAEMTELIIETIQQPHE